MTGEAGKPAGPPSPAAMARLGEAWGLIRSGRPEEARLRLEALVREAPDLAQAHELLAYAWQALGDLATAERELRAAAALDPSQPAYAAALAALLVHLGRTAEAEAAFQAALLADPGFAPAAEKLASIQEAAGKVEEAEATTRAWVGARPESAPGWSRLARLAQAAGRLEEAEAAYRTAVRLDPADAAAHVALADNLWMRGRELATALAGLDEALRRRPSVSLLAAKARLMARAGRADEAFALVAEAVRGEPGNAGLQATAASAAAAADRRPEMLAHALAAERLRPDDPGAAMLVAHAHLRLGEFQAAADLLDRRLAAEPFDQQALALRAICWRMLGDARYGELYDYERLVRTFTLEPPPGWRDPKSFLADLSAALAPLHRFEGHPLEQSLRAGSQTSHDLSVSKNPVIRAFFSALQAPIDDYVAALDAAPEALRARRNGGWRIVAGWSVRLRPQGFHLSHVHPDGWISSAFYVETPAAVRAGDRQGWLQFGDPGSPMEGRPGPDHFVEPTPGKLVLFPSYMFHGTRPFTGDESRLTIAFDVAPR